MKSIRLNLRAKTTIYIFLGFFFVITGLIVMVYMENTRLIKNTVGHNNVEKTFLIASAFSRIINEEVADLKYYMSENEVRRGVKHHYRGVKDIPRETIKDTYLDIDSRWPSKGEEDTVMQEILKTPLSLQLARIVREDDGVDEILISDRYGGLIAASNETTDYYQADEEWWQKAYKSGGGMSYLGETYFDKSAQRKGSPFVYCMKDENGRIVGIAKVLLNSERLFAPLQSSVYEERGGGHISLLSGEGEVIAHPAAHPLSHTTMEKEGGVLRAFKLHDSGWLVTDSGTHQEKELLSFYKVENSFLENGGHVWFAVSHISKQRAFAALNQLLEHLVFIGFVALGLSVFMGWWLGKKFTAPVYVLIEGVKKFGKGNLEYKIHVNHEYEMNLLARSLNNMAADLKEKMISVDALNRALDKGRESEAQLRKSQENFRNIIQNNIFGTLVVDEDGRCLFVNSEAENIFGKPGHQLLGHQIGLPVVVGEKSEVSVSGGGRQKICEMRAAKTFWQDQQASLIILRDITEEKLLGKNLDDMRRQLIQAEKMSAVGQLSAGVAHEVKNPLAIVTLAIDSLKSHIPDMDENIQLYFRMITESTERANKVVMDLMNFARYSELEMKDLKIIEVVQSTIGLIENSARIKGVEISRDFQCPEDGVVLGDFQLLEQGFLNIFGNALDAITEEKGKIGVKIFILANEEDAGQKVVRIEISDTGCGISEEKIKDIFNPFFTTKEQGKGTGLGLSMVFMIIENHKGTIKAESQEGEGTTFIIDLPLKK